MRTREQAYQDSGAVQAGLVRIGIVTDVDREKRTARVRYPDTDKTSDWLGVLVNQDVIPDYEGTQKTGVTGGGSGYAAFADHAHSLTIRPWMPQIGEQVLALYLPVRNGDGFILGGIRPWR